MLAQFDASYVIPVLADAARAIGATVSDAPAYLTGDRFNSEVLSDAISGSALRRQGSELPQAVNGVLFDGFPVLVGALSGPPNRANVATQLRRYRNQATIARSWLGAQAPNLHLFLAGPPGAIGDGSWRQLAAEIEADDRVCRKLIWLFDATPTFESARVFLERTFIARPWPTEQRVERLDSIANFALPPGWEEALQNQELDFTALVDQLIELHGGEIA
jgi:hypothetical protein